MLRNDGRRFSLGPGLTLLNYHVLVRVKSLSSKNTAALTMKYHQISTKVYQALLVGLLCGEGLHSIMFTCGLRTKAMVKLHDATGS